MPVLHFLWNYQEEINNMNNLVLLVEDELKTAEMLSKALEMEGISVTAVTSGRDALEVMAKGKFDLIILDLKLPEMSGDEVLEHIRRIDEYVDVIVYTNYQDPPVMKKLINLGVDGFISKGGAADLWETVDKVKARLDPFSEEERKALVQSLPKGTFYE
ncbi:hypothetical protein CSQ92_07380 [Janthinobacterium sp. BJB446]|nr:hypothetical protein CSQ92_07380 [Janthinobacterium sp. BJB446]